MSHRNYLRKGTLFLHPKQSREEAQCIQKSFQVICRHLEGNMLKKANMTSLQQSPLFMRELRMRQVQGLHLSYSSAISHSTEHWHSGNISE